MIQEVQDYVAKEARDPSTPPDVHLMLTPERWDAFVDELFHRGCRLPDADQHIAIQTFRGRWTVGRWR